MIDMNLMSIFRWMEYLFPSLAGYVDIVGPLVVMFVGVISIFTNILPEPGHQFHVPDKNDLKSTLKKTHSKIYYLSLISRDLTVLVNILMRSWGYRFFYNSTGYISSLLRRFKLTYRSKTFYAIEVPKPIVSSKEFDEFVNDINEEQ